MKTKLIYAIALTLLVQITNAQTIGFRGGVNLSNMTMRVGGTDFTPESLYGFQFGPVVDFSLNKHFDFNTGLIYSLKGYNLKNPNYSLLGNASFMNGMAKLSYMVIPLNFAYKIPFSSKSSFFVQAGPYVGLSMGGSVKSNNYLVPLQDIYQYGYLAKADYGIGAGAGLQFGHMIYTVNYEYGLRNLNAFQYTSDITGSFRTASASFTITYMFGKLGGKVTE